MIPIYRYLPNFLRLPRNIYFTVYVSVCMQKKLKSKELGIASVAQKVNKINKKQCLKAVWSLGKHSWTCMKSYDSKTITGHQYTHHRIAVVLFVFPLSKNVSINTKQSCTLKDFIYLNDISFYFFVLYLYHIG